jgi:hypothetical protein
MLDTEKFKKRIQKEIDHNVNRLRDIEPKDIVRVFDILMHQRVASVLSYRELLTNFDTYEPAIREIIGNYKKFSFDFRDDSIFFVVGGYFIGRVKLIETKPHFMQVDEDFSIKKFREYVNNTIIKERVGS